MNLCNVFLIQVLCTLVHANSFSAHVARRLLAPQPGTASTETQIYQGGTWIPCLQDSDCALYLGWGKCNNSTGACYRGRFGEGCKQNSDCLSNSCSTYYKVCVEAGCSATCSNNPSTFCWSGFCYPLQPLGGNCRSNSECTSSRCYYGTCSLVAPPSCLDLVAPCAAGTYCSFGFCYLKLPSGSPCTSSDQCLTHSCGSDGRCSDTPPRCSCADDSCSTACPFRTYCSSDNYCLPKGADGRPCSSNEACESNLCLNNWCAAQRPTCPPCLPSQYCDDSTLLCTPKRPTYAACTSGPQCQTTYCNTLLNLCTPPEGAPCSPQSTQPLPTQSSTQGSSPRTATPFPQLQPAAQPCPRGQYCQAGIAGWTCTLQKTSNAPCSSNTECQSNYCTPNLKLCTPPEGLTCTPSLPSPTLSLPSATSVPSAPQTLARSTVSQSQSQFQSQQSPCPKGQYCQQWLPGSGSCALLKPAEQSCGGDSECQSAYCNVYFRVCTAPPGATCFPTPLQSPVKTCPTGQYCAQSAYYYRCTLLKAAGEACSAHAECANQVCLFSKCSGAANLDAARLQG